MPSSGRSGLGQAISNNHFGQKMRIRQNVHMQVLLYAKQVYLDRDAMITTALYSCSLV